MHSVELDRHIVVIEDSVEDFEVLQRAFEKCRTLNPIIHFTTGDEALARLIGDEDSIEPPLRGVAIILLDLNLPGSDGCDILQKLKSDPRTRQIPIIVLTSSINDVDVARCYEYGVNSYLQKPMGVDEFYDAIAQLKDYWLSTSILPAKN